MSKSEDLAARPTIFSDKESQALWNKLYKFHFQLKGFEILGSEDPEMENMNFVYYGRNEEVQRILAFSESSFLYDLDNERVSFRATNPKNGFPEETEQILFERKNRRRPSEPKINISVIRLQLVEHCFLFSELANLLSSEDFDSIYQRSQGREISADEAAILINDLKL